MSGKHTNHYNLTTAELLHHCTAIAEEYGNQGLKLTVRQLYYQLVARGLEPNGQHHYKRIVTVLSQARLDGRFPMTLLEDRGRDVGMTKTDTSLSVADAEHSVARDVRQGPEHYIWVGRWFAQPCLPFVWVEKEALAGVFERPCGDAKVGLFPCKGYPSLQALWHWIEQVREAYKSIHDEYENEEALEALRHLGIDKDAVWTRVEVLYFGDHDPDGLEIPHSAERNIQQLIESHADEHGDWFPEVYFHRIALTKEQIRQYDPPPFPAKESSSRYAQYVRQTGLTDAWELDALEPRVLQRLITEEIAKRFDTDIHQRLAGHVFERRKRVRETIASPGWIDRTLGRDEDADF